MSETTQLLNEISPGATTPVESVHQEVHDEHGSAFPPFESDTFASQLLWLAITFGALYFLMSRIALPRVASILEVRSDRIATDLAEADRLKQETEAAIAAYEGSLATARANAQKIAGETRDKVQKEVDAQRKALEDQLAGRLAEAEKQIAATKMKALENVRAIATDAATDIVAQLLGDKPDTKAVEAAVEASLKN
jgi:F-type H+-transporting ATPase subunit b